MEPVTMNEVKKAVIAEEKKEKSLSLAEQVKLEKQIRADDCVKELSETIDKITEKYNCRLVVQMVITEQGNIPQLTVAANDLK